MPRQGQKTGCLGQGDRGAAAAAQVGQDGSPGAQATGVGKGRTGHPDGKGLSPLLGLAAAHSGFVSAVKGAKGALESGGRIWIMGWAWGIPRGQLEERGCWRNLHWETCRVPPPPGQPSGSHGPCSASLVRVSGPGVGWGHHLGRDPPPPLSYALRSSRSEEPPRAGQLASWAAVGQADVSSLWPAHLGHRENGWALLSRSQSHRSGEGRCRGDLRVCSCSC